MSDESSKRKSLRRRYPTGPIKAVFKMDHSTDIDIESGVLPPPPIIDTKKFESLAEKDKMAALVTFFNQMAEKMLEVNTSINHEQGGLCVRLALCQNQLDDFSENILKVPSLEKEVVQIPELTKKLSIAEQDLIQLKLDNHTLQGIVQRQSTHIAMLNDKVVDLTTRSMENNLIISGLEDDEKKEISRPKAVSFLKDMVELDMEKSEIDAGILVAHRMGTYVKDKHRAMIIRCIPSLKEKILENKENLKGKKNSQERPYYINTQLPESVQEKKRENRQLIKKIKDSEQNLNKNDKSKIEVKKGKVYVEGTPQRKYLQPIQPSDLFPSVEERAKWDKIKLVSSDVTSIEGNDFVGFATATSQFQDVKRAYRKLRSLYPTRDHIVAAYRLKNGYTGFQDDGEHGAGHRLLDILKELGSKDVAIFAIRAFAGHIGPKRFQAYSDTTKQAIERLFPPKPPGANFK